MKAFKIIGLGLLALILMDVVYVGYSQVAMNQNAYVAVQDDSDF